MRGYYGRLLKAAFWHSLGPIDLWSGLVGLIAPALLHYRPELGSVVNAYLWQVPFWIAGAVVVVRILLAPYWLARDDAERIARLNGEMSRLSAKRTELRVKFDKKEPYHHQKDVYHYWRFAIRNEGAFRAGKLRCPPLRNGARSIARCNGCPGLSTDVEPIKRSFLTR
jgi:hypothetical protein